MSGLSLHMKFPRHTGVNCISYTRGSFPNTRDQTHVSPAPWSQNLYHSHQSKSLYIFLIEPLFIFSASSQSLNFPQSQDQDYLFSGSTESCHRTTRAFTKAKPAYSDTLGNIKVFLHSLDAWISSHWHSGLPSSTQKTSIFQVHHMTAHICVFHLIQLVYTQNTHHTYALFVN